MECMRDQKPRRYGGNLNISKMASGNIVLLGDAAHSMVPILGQGMNAGLVDAYVLTQFLSG